MKKLFTISLFVVIMLSSCITDNTDLSWSEKVPITLNINKNSRVNDTTFEEGDKIGLYVVNYNNGTPGTLVPSGNHVDNICFTLSDTWTPSEEVYWIDKNTNTDFYVYYPYNPETIADVSAYTVSVNTDQSNQEYYFASDFLWGKKEHVIPTKEAVSVNTQHMFSNALIHIIPGEGFTAEEIEASDISVMITNVKTRATIDLATGVVTPTDENRTIHPWNTGEYYRAMIIPQTINSEYPLIEVTINNLKYVLQEDITFAPGSRHKIEVVINRPPSNEVSVTFSITEWTDDETIYGGDANLTVAYTAQDLIKALITTYTGQGQKDFGYPALMMAYDYMAGEFIPNSFGWDYSQFYWTLLQNGHDADQGMPHIYWNNYVGYIKMCNNIIATCKPYSAFHNPTLVGTAKTLRALSHLEMACLYEALPAESQLRPEYATELEKVQGLTVPIISESANSRNNPRATREEIFTFIFADLKAAEKAFSNGYIPESKAFPSLAVVYGLKARAYLWLGGFEDGLYAEIPTGNAAYEKAAEYARKAITASGATPLTKEQYVDKTNGFNSVNQAWLWAMIQSQDTVLSNLHSFTAQIAPEANWGYGGIIGPGVRKCVYDRMSDTDFRKCVIVGPTTTYADFAQYTNIPSAAYWAQWGAFGYGVYPYTSFKFRPAGGEMSNSSTGNATSIPLMRVEEMMLIEAEATAHYDAATGMALLEAFMAYRDPNYTYAATDLIEEIIFQKRVELWGEGLILFDLKRLDYGIDNAYEGANALNGWRFKTDHRVPLWNFCIPLAEVQQNVALDGKNNPNPSAALKSHDVAGE